MHFYADSIVFLHPVILGCIIENMWYEPICLFLIAIIMVKKVYWAFIGFVVSIIVIACSNEPQIADKTLYQTQQEQRDKYMPYMYGTWVQCNQK